MKMSKLSKHFQFELPISETWHSGGRPVTTHLFDLLVEGIGYQYEEEDERGRFFEYDYDLNSILWEYEEGKFINAMPIISAAFAGRIVEFDYLRNACLAHVEKAFEKKETFISCEEPEYEQLSPNYRTPFNQEP